MTTVCKSGKITDDISYIIIQNDEKDFDITLTAYNTRYKNKTTTTKSAASWIEQTINIIQGNNNEGNRNNGEEAA